jgi:hypothetical protein
VRLMEQDILNGAAGQRPGSAEVASERRLMAAILADAFDCYQKYMFTNNVRQRKLFREAEIWLQSDDYWVFSFRNICEVLGLDVSALREQAGRWRRQQVADEHHVGLDEAAA